MRLKEAPCSAISDVKLVNFLAKLYDRFKGLPGIGTGLMNALQASVARPRKAVVVSMSGDHGSQPQQVGHAVIAPSKIVAQYLANLDIRQCNFNHNDADIMFKQFFDTLS